MGAGRYDVIVVGARVAGAATAMLLARQGLRRRDRAIRAMYDFTLGLAAFAPPTLSQRHALAAIASDQAETDRFLGAFAGIVPVDEYFTPAAMLSVLGPRGVGKLAAATANQLFASVRQRHPAQPAKAATEVP